MKFLLLLAGVYMFYRFFLREPKKLSRAQEPDLFVDHEEIKRDHENK